MRLKRKIFIILKNNFSNNICIKRIYLYMDNALFDMFLKMFGGNGSMGSNQQQTNSQQQYMNQQNSQQNMNQPNPAFSYYPHDIFKKETNNNRNSQNNNNFNNNPNFNSNPNFNNNYNNNYQDNNNFNNQNNFNSNQNFNQNNYNNFSNSQTNNNDSMQNMMPMLMSLMGKGGNMAGIAEMLSGQKGMADILSVLGNKDKENSSNNFSPPDDEILL